MIPPWVTLSEVEGFPSEYWLLQKKRLAEASFLLTRNGISGIFFSVLSMKGLIMNMLIVAAVAVLFFLAYLRFIARNRDGFMRSHRAYGEILELVDWEWMRRVDLLKKIESKYGDRSFFYRELYRFLRLLEKDGKIEQRELTEDWTSPDGNSGIYRIAELRKLPAPSENDSQSG